MQDGLVGFKELLKEFRGLSVWAVGGSVAAPFAAALAALSPPWPPAIVLVTAVAELIALIYVYQFLKKARRRTINRIIAAGGLALVVLGGLYLAAISLYTYEVPTTRERFVKGSVCTEEAASGFKQKCPDLRIDELKTAEFDADRLWTSRSIAATRMAIVGLWLTAFMTLSVLVGSFLVYQLQVPDVRRRATKLETGSP
jgi:ABC-type xylose transport system permease subunit